VGLDFERAAEMGGALFDAKKAETADAMRIETGAVVLNRKDNPSSRTC
jgi:hypothetical protein